MKARMLAIGWLLGATVGCDRDPQALVTVDASSVQGTRCMLDDGGDAGVEEGFFCEVSNGCDQKVGSWQPIHDDPDCDEAGAMTTFAPQCGCDKVSYFNSCLRRAAAVSAYSTTEACETISDPSDQFKFFGTICVPGDPMAACPEHSNANGCAWLGTAQTANPLVTFLDNYFDAGISPEQFTQDILRQCSGAPFAGTLSSAELEFVSSAGACWKVPDACPTPLDGGPLFHSCSSKCTSACAAISRGGLVGHCDPDASAD